MPGDRERAGRAYGRVAGERQLAAGREDAHAPRMGRVAWRKDEGRFWEVELARDRLHRIRADPARVGQHRELVAAERLVGEHVEDHEVVTHLLTFQPWTSSSISTDAPSGNAATATVVRAGKGASNCSP